MRQLTIRVPDGRGREVVNMARAHKGSSVSVQDATDGEHALQLVHLHLSNSEVEGLLDDLEAIPDAHITLQPRGVIALRPPASEAPEQVLDVQARSPIEIFLGGLQSIGSWTGFLGYAAAAGVVVWIALFTEVIFLLTAAMLIAPFAGPAMNAALATARGDGYLFRQSIIRYFAALGVTIAVAFLLSLLLQQEIATGLMVQMSLLPSVAVLLPLIAGAAGALNLCQSDRSSLVSGAATGMLVAASLAPPAGIVGMGLAIGETGMVISAVFVLLLQVVGINVSGAIVFRLYGVSPRGARYDRGKKWVSYTSWLGAIGACAALLTWQFWSEPDLLRSTQAQRATADVRSVVKNSGVAQLVQANAQFTRGDVANQNTMLVTLYVQSSGEADEAATRAALTAAIKQKLRADYNVTPLVDVTVLEE